MFYITTAIVTLTGAAYAQTVPATSMANCPEGVQSCNIAGVFKSNESHVDSNDNTYAPDSASSSSSIGDVIAQGGASDSRSSAIGNRSDNRNTNNSSANNTGSVTGTANTNSGNINTNAQGGAGGSSVQGQQQGQKQTATSNQQQGITKSGNSRSVSSTGAVSNNSGSNSSANNTGNKQQSRQQTNVDARNQSRTTIRHSASSAYAPNLINGATNCFGDAQGSFTAGIQTFGWGVTAGRSKGSNVCAVAALMGPRAAAAYLANKDEQVRRMMIDNGMAVTKSQVIKQQTVQQTKMKPVKLSCPGGHTLVEKLDSVHGYVCRKTPVTSSTVNTNINCPSSHPRLVNVKGEFRCYK